MKLQSVLHLNSRVEKFNLLNLIFFNIAWIGLVFWRDSFVIIAIAYLVVHVFYLSRMSKEWQLIVIVTAFGVLLDSYLHFLDIFIFEDRSLIPLWLVVLWGCFSTTICHSLAFLERSKVAQALVGGVLAPLSYLAGEHYDAVRFSYSPSNTYLILMPIWSLLFLSVFQLKKRLVGHV